MTQKILNGRARRSAVLAQRDLARSIAISNDTARLDEAGVLPEPLLTPERPRP